MIKSILLAATLALCATAASAETWQGWKVSPQPSEKPPQATEFEGFRIGMSETEMFSAARRKGYQLEQVSGGNELGGSYWWKISPKEVGGGIGVCFGKLFSVNRSFNADFHVFIGLIKERQNQYGEPQWKVQQYYSTDGKQFSSLEAGWDDPTNRVQPSISMAHYGDRPLETKSVTIAYSAWKYLCRQQRNE
jgi:hypothetical protein